MISFRTVFTLLTSGLAIAAALFFAAPMAAQAQTQGQISAERTPALPAPLQNLVDGGAQLRYLGNQGGLHGWIAIQGGQEQYFYVTPDGNAFVMGLLFDRDGKMLTMRQVADLQQQSGGEALEFFAEESTLGKAPEAGALKGPAPEFKTPSEQLYDDVTAANWIPLGQPDAPFIYSFIDPQCPFCHDLVRDLRKDYIENGAVQLRMIPVGYKEGSKEMASFLLAVPNPQARWYRHLDGDREALPVTPGINEQGVQRNMAIMQSWKFNVTPLSVYRGKDGKVKIIQGRVRDIPALIADLAPPS